jgi:hypothetical protein
MPADSSCWSISRSLGVALGLRPAGCSGAGGEGEVTGGLGQQVGDLLPDRAGALARTAAGRPSTNTK